MTNPPPGSMRAALAANDQLVALHALADRLADSLDDPDRPAHTTAPLARELAKVVRVIDELESEEPEQSLHEALADARKARAARKAAGQ